MVCHDDKKNVLCKKPPGEMQKKGSLLKKMHLGMKKDGFLGKNYRWDLWWEKLSC
jgi:hypothetical protein